MSGFGGTISVKGFGHVLLKCQEFFGESLFPTGGFRGKVPVAALTVPNDSAGQMVVH